VTYVVYYLFFFANFDDATIVNLVSDFTCFFIIFCMGMDLRGSILLSSGSFTPKYLRNDENAVLIHFGVKSSNSTKLDLRGLWFGRQWSCCRPYSESKLELNSKKLNSSDMKNFSVFIFLSYTLKPNFRFSSLRFVR